MKIPDGGKTVVMRTLSAPDRQAPVMGAILDLKKVIHIIHQSSLVVLYGLLGFEDFMELLCVIALSEDEDPREDLESFLSAKEFQSLLQYNINLEELHYELVMFQRFLTTDLLYPLPVKIKQSFEKYGFRISRWLSSTEVIIESNESDSVWNKGRIGRFRDKTFQEVGSDRRSAGHIETLRVRTNIEDHYIPF